MSALTITSLDREVQEAASDLIYQVSVTFYDAGRLAMSERAGSLALALTFHAQNFPAQARAYDVLSRVALYQNDSTRAVQYAQRGLRIPDLPASRTSSLHMRLGRALVAAKEQRLVDLINEPRSSRPLRSPSHRTKQEDLHYYGPVRLRAPQRYSPPRVSDAWGTPYRPPLRAGLCRDTPSHVPHESSRSSSRHLCAGRRLAKDRAPARLIPG